ncbi:hypothetical protein [Streptomyces sp. ODS05-4]|uniref:hypothetical protein n=1 Tax=Streptomyces sp. ODS05-4 TaxID=2944939 RepID=UPI00210EC699|nr:hypothetical protein [Streptomyces sp. ODS05-4]
MNQLGDKPEEIRRHLSEEKRKGRRPEHDRAADEQRDDAPAAGRPRRPEERRRTGDTPSGDTSTGDAPAG